MWYRHPASLPCCGQEPAQWFKPKLPKEANSASVNLFTAEPVVVVQRQQPRQDWPSLEVATMFTGNWKCPGYHLLPDFFRKPSVWRMFRHTPNDCRFGRPHSSASKEAWQLVNSLHALKTLKTLKALPEQCRPPRSQNKSCDEPLDIFLRSGQVWKVLQALGH